MSAPCRVPPSVAVLLVSHDGSRWLPTVLAALVAQDAVARGFLEQVVAVDTGSTDGSAEMVEAALAAGGLRAEVLREDDATSFPGAVRTGLDQLRANGSGARWLWILHDDSTPAPDALGALLAAAEEHPQADLLGPKLREWPSLRRLLELGVTITGTGQRETGLERGEYDQGQHDDVREVLAVNTAGMLVRRSVLEDLGGLDPALPVFGNDIDLGWRAAAAGHTTLVVPQAVVFHAEAAHRGTRRTTLTGRRTRHEERRAALWTLLANTSGRRLPFQAVRLVLGTVLRAVGLVLVRAPGEAFDELTALGSVLSGSGGLRAARRRRRESLPAGWPADQDRVDRLLAPFWLPYRHGLDVVGDLLAAISHQAADVADRRRVATAAHDPSSMAARRLALEDDDDALADTGLVVRVLTNPIALVLVVVVLAMLVAGRAALGSASGGALSAAPGSAGAWWTLWLESWHPLAQGTPVPAPAYLVPLAALGSVLTPGGAVSVLMLLAAPLALWGSWRLLRVVGRLVSPRGSPRWLLVAGATTYALGPLASGAWGAGRLGVVAASVLVPWVAHAALAFVDPDPDRRWRAAWRTGLLLSLLTAFAPVAWLLALALGLVAALGGLLLEPTAARAVRAWGPPLAALSTVPVLLAAWWVPLVVHGAGAGLLLDVGRVLPAEARTSGAALLVGRIGELGAAGAPWWAGAVLVVLALLALVPRSTRVGVLGCWSVALVVAAVALTLSLVPLDVGGAPAAVGLGVLLVAWQACLVTAAVLGGQALAGPGPGGSGPAPGVRRSAVVAVALAAAVAPVVGLTWAVLPSSAALEEDPASDVPAYMVQSAMTGPEHGVLVVRGAVEDGLTYEVLRDDGVRLGEDEVIDLSAEDAGLGRVVRALVSRPRSATVTDLATAGVEYVVMPAPADGRVAAGLDAASGLVQASAEDRRTRAWQVDRELDPAAVDGPGSWWRVALLVASSLAVLVALVLAAPTTREARP